MVFSHSPGLRRPRLAGQLCYPHSGFRVWVQGVVRALVKSLPVGERKGGQTPALLRALVQNGICHLCSHPDLIIWPHQAVGKAGKDHL